MATNQHKVKMIFSHTRDDGTEGELGIDEDSRLYWNNELIVTEKRIKLSFWVNASVIAGGISTIVIAVFTALLYLKPC